jgi:hypothetical protein
MMLLLPLPREAAYLLRSSSGVSVCTLCTGKARTLSTWPARCPTSQRLCLMPTCCLCLMPYAYLLIRSAYLARSLPDVASRSSFVGVP